MGARFTDMTQPWTTHQSCTTLKRFTSIQRGSPSTQDPTFLLTVALEMRYVFSRGCNTEFRDALRISYLEKIMTQLSNKIMNAKLCRQKFCPYRSPKSNPNCKQPLTAKSAHLTALISLHAFASFFFMLLDKKSEFWCYLAGEIKMRSAASFY